MRNDVLVHVRNVEKRFRRGSEDIHVLSGLSLEVPRGEFLALMGPSGSGKTTLLNLIGGLDRPTGGSVEIEGERIDGFSDRKLAAWRARHVGLVFQMYNLLPVLTAERNVDLPLLLTHLSRQERRKHVEAALAVVGLSHRARHFPRQMSGGEQQRLSLARAFATNPEILFLDEPTASLDPASVLLIEDVIRDARQQGMRIIFVTHDIGQAKRLADDVVFVHRGQVVAYQQSETFFTHPASEQARAYLDGKIIL